jgi:hypothetical protein
MLYRNLDYPKLKHLDHLMKHHQKKTEIYFSSNQVTHERHHMRRNNKIYLQQSCKNHKTSCIFYVFTFLYIIFFCDYIIIGQINLHDSSAAPPAVLLIPRAILAIGDMPRGCSHQMRSL